MRRYLLALFLLNLALFAGFQARTWLAERPRLAPPLHPESIRLLSPAEWAHLRTLPASEGNCYVWGVLHNDNLLTAQSLLARLGLPAKLVSYNDVAFELRLENTSLQRLNWLKNYMVNFPATQLAPCG